MKIPILSRYTLVFIVKYKINRDNVQDESKTRTYIYSKLLGDRVPCGRSSLTNEKDHHYFLNRFVCVGEFFDG